MAMEAGTRLGPYQILAPIGAGGMGEVYRARDTRLDRTVAIKALPAHLAANPELRQRYEREARAVSSLNHPHICVLYDIGQQDGIDFLVMEYLEGETLAARLAQGPLPLDQTLRYAIQIADALAQAHRQSVFHRDLKPGNIMLTRTGSKLLDFGLARIGPSRQGSKPDAPTVSEGLTQKGAILGTFQYMAPEQLEGKDADGRSDIFAFGAVLHEMATGRKAFVGSSQASLIAAILKEDPPPVSQLQPLTPPGLDRSVRKCLAKDPELRWQTAADLKDELEWIAGGAAAPVVLPGADRWKRLPWVAAAMLLVVAVLGWALYALRAPAAHQPIYRLTVLPPPGTTVGSDYRSFFALSPDGRLLAFVAAAQGRTQLYLRPLDSADARPLPGTDGASYPFWSPDSQHLGFFADRKLKKVSASGAGPPQVICDAPYNRGGAWNRDNVILFAPNPGSVLHRVSAFGGQPTPLTKLNTKLREDAHYWPQFLPDGRRFLFFARSTPPESSAIAFGALDRDSPHTRLDHSGPMAVYAAPGYLLLVTEGTLVARRFYEQRLQIESDATPVVSGVGSAIFVGRAFFSVSENGVLAYRSGEIDERRLTWFGRAGQTLGVLAAAGAYRRFRLSPDQRRLAAEIIDPQTGAPDIWAIDIARGISRGSPFPRAWMGARCGRPPVIGWPFVPTAPLPSICFGRQPAAPPTRSASPKRAESSTRRIGLLTDVTCCTRNTIPTRGGTCGSCRFPATESQSPSSRRHPTRCKGSFPPTGAWLPMSQMKRIETRSTFRPSLLRRIGGRFRPAAVLSRAGAAMAGSFSTHAWTSPGGGGSEVIRNRFRSWRSQALIRAAGATW